jgi:hypothetical protein
MSTTARFPLASTTTRASLASRTLFVALTTAAVASAPARADDNMLRGPHPFLKDNELSAHVLLVAGGDNTPGGTKIATDYGYKLGGPAWLDLQLNYQHAACHAQGGGSDCDAPAGSIFETLVGVKLKWPTAIPVVPFVKAGVGLAYAFPNAASNGFGPVARVGGGANYFFFDWLGLGAELGASAGHLSTASGSYTLLDFGGGLEFQF